MKKPTHIVGHHTAVSYDKNPDQWPATDRYHRNKGWGGGGYNYEINKAGGRHQFRADGSPTAAQYQQNMNDGRAISFAVDGNFDIELPTDAQCQEIYNLITEKMARYNISRENVDPHRKYAGYKSCWGKLLPDDILTYVETRLGIDPTPEAFKEAIQISIDENIATHWDYPNKDITNEELCFLFYRIGWTEKLHEKLSKAEVVHIINKQGALKRAPNTSLNKPNYK